MQILSAAQTRLADQATIEEEGIASIDLMERAAQAFTTWLTARQTPAEAGEILICCGPGNNGGDGLAVARRLHGASYAVRVALLPAERRSTDFETNHKRLPEAIPAQELNAGSLPLIQPGTLVVDALFGTGITRPLDGLAAAVVEHINQAGARVVSIDMPSGLLTDSPQPSDSPIIRARHTVSFELPKLAFLLPQNARYVGQWHLAPISLSRTFLKQAVADMHLVEDALLAGRLPRRATFAHKGTFGHALLVAGSYGKMGAAVLAAGACLRSGVGLLTVAAPKAGYDTLQSQVPEAMCRTDRDKDHISELPDLRPYSAVGIGPGLGQHDDTRAALEELLCTVLKLPLVLDADALNLLGANRGLLDLLPPRCLLTPHPREFERLTEPARDDYHRLELLRAFCAQYDCYVILKGAHSCLGTPEGTLYFNSTGNPGMATGGSGDVLTGVLTALLAQGLTPLDAALLGMYAHGRAGDRAAAQTGQIGLIAGDLVQHIGPALEELVDLADNF
ncbi:NAD(P)H-hydrate dehydratase [Hymenobacter sp. BT175]|uniref:NAD(P)H-hydrate dehydratase n=1 Tax=Hymenobacter translucens TaxID=2886507 RepID=UPI001D0F4192|nr:NAD(P)H-hydrate dehydratase [Hymenobacter translucens]MCC2546058.1 NAD(P)H-hydrate dehydratase [Hymenobacter translucens]